MEEQAASNPLDNGTWSNWLQGYLEWKEVERNTTSDIKCSLMHYLPPYLQCCVCFTVALLKRLCSSKAWRKKQLCV